MMRLIFALLSILPLMIAANAVAETDKRVALVIGNANYANATQLANPVNDATLIATKLNELGFEVHLHKDLSFDGFTEALRSFEDELADAETALFYYAGHGMQFREQNFLLSSDAKIRDQQDVVTSGKSLGNIVEMMETRVPLSLVFVDACRNNPFADALRRKLAGRSRALGLNRGLTMPKNTANTLIAFATKPNEVALDGADETNSPFTIALANHLDTPNIEVSTMLKRVTRDVLEMTDNQQRPEVVASMESEFYFFHNASIAAPVVTYDNDVEREAAATLALNEAMTSNTIVAYRTIIEQFPQTAASNIADRFLKDLQKTEIGKVMNQADPNSEIALSAHALIDRMSEASKSGRKLQVASASPEEIEHSLGLDSEAYKKVQLALNMLGHDAGDPDGAFGVKSRSAMRTFQVANRIEDTGYIDQNSLVQLIKVFEETPKVLDGPWSMEVHRFNPHPQDPADINGRTMLATAKLRFRDGDFFISNWRNLAGENRKDGRNPFASFRGSVTSGRKLSMRFEADYLFQKKKTRNIEIRGSVPEFVAYGSTLKFNGPRIERIARYDELWIRIELKRLPPSDG